MGCYAVAAYFSEMCLDAANYIRVIISSTFGHLSNELTGYRVRQRVDIFLREKAEC